jgi:hypothetical protein
MGQEEEPFSHVSEIEPHATAIRAAILPYLVPDDIGLQVNPHSSITRDPHPTRALGTHKQKRACAATTLLTGTMFSSKSSPNVVRSWSQKGILLPSTPHYS